MKKERTITKADKEVEKIRDGVMKTEFKNTGNKMGKISEEVFERMIKPFHPDKRKLTLGQKTADLITKWAGSWTFIILFFAFLGLWMATGGYFILNLIKGGTFEDHYPFILLNLVLSCIAAIQAPIILMSQNRTTQRDRQRAEYDYQVNRKAEKGIRELKIQLDRIERTIK